MPLQLKKREAGPATAPAWHPNFRDFERLPDTKVVRTTFFINVGAGVLALVLGGIVGWREFQTRTFVDQTAAAQERIDANRKQNAEGLRLTKIFTEEDKKFAEAADFVRSPIEPTALIQELGVSLPPEIQLEFVDLRAVDPGNPQCTLRGLAAGTKDQASGAASAYVEVLRTHPRFAELFETVNLTTVNTDPRSGMLIFEIVLKFRNQANRRKQ